MWHYLILEYFPKTKYMEDVISEIDIITTYTTEEIIRYNSCQMSFLEKLELIQDVGKKYK